MKKLLFIVLPVLALLAACTQKVDEKPTVVAVASISLNKTELQFIELGEKETLTVTVLPADATDKTVSWSSDKPDVASVKGGVVTAEGYGVATITASAGDKSAQCRVEVIAPDPVEEFSILTSSASLSCEEQALDVEVLSTLDYEISSLPEWIGENGTEASGENRRIHHFTVSANDSEESRSGVIVFCNAYNSCVPFQVEQEGRQAPDVMLGVSPIDLSFSAEAASASLEIVANISWTISADADWCHVTPGTGSGNGQVGVSVDANEAEESRSAVITLASEDGSLSETVNVTQAAAEKADVTADWTQDFYHRSLVMRFTATWCGYCPMMATALKTALSKAPDKLVPLNLHTGSSDLAFGPVSTLENQYLIEGFPSGIVDGRQDVPNYKNTDTTAEVMLSFMEETEAHYPVASGISFTSSLDGEDVHVGVSLFLRYADDYKVTVILTESGIIQGQKNGNKTDKNYQHDDIARLSFTQVDGDAFTTGEDQSVRQLEYSAALAPEWNKDNLKVVVYVQRAYGTQEVIASGDYGPYYVDNAVYAPVGESVELQYVR